MASKPKHKMEASDAGLPPLEAGLTPVTWSDIHPGVDEPEDWKNDFILLDIARVMDSNYKTFKWSLIMALASAVTTVIVSVWLGGLDKLPFFLQLTLVPASLISVFYAIYAFLRHMDLSQKAVLATDHLLFGHDDGEKPP
ncbi:MAG: hypothetical protein HY556_08330 [Euryarchaeota archaeon]|nr:hypothetical protein [Euryarchaeota archaeon]